MYTNPIDLHQDLKTLLENLPLKDALMGLYYETDLNLRWANSNLTSNGSGAHFNLLLTLITKESKVAHTSINASLLTPSSLTKLVDSLYEEALLAPVTEHTSFPQLTPPSTYPTSFISLSADSLSSLTHHLGREFSLTTKDTAHHFGYAELHLAQSWIFSLSGNTLYQEEKTGRLELQLRDYPRSAWVGINTTDFTSLNYPALFEKLHSKLALQNNFIPTPPGKYTVILTPGATADLFNDFAYALGENDAFDGTSPFSAPNGKTRLGEKLSSLPINIYSDPSNPYSSESPYLINFTPSREELLADNFKTIRPTYWLKDGTLNALANNSLSASTHQTQFTPDQESLIMELPGSDKTLSQLISETSDGLLIDCLWYIRSVDEQAILTTGLTRDGVYLIKDGVIVGSTNNFRFNESPLQILQKIRSVGKTELAQPRECAETLSKFAMPPLVVENFNLSSISESI